MSPLKNTFLVFISLWVSDTYLCLITEPSCELVLLRSFCCTLPSQKFLLERGGPEFKDFTFCWVDELKSVFSMYFSVSWLNDIKPLLHPWLNNILWGNLNCLGPSSTIIRLRKWWSSTPSIINSLYFLPYGAAPSQFFSVFSIQQLSSTERLLAIFSMSASSLMILAQRCWYWLRLPWVHCLGRMPRPVALRITFIQW